MSGRPFEAGGNENLSFGRQQRSRYAHPHGWVSSQDQPADCPRCVDRKPTSGLEQPAKKRVPAEFCVDTLRPFCYSTCLAI
jgi:hypothetical protein